MLGSNRLVSKPTVPLARPCSRRTRLSQHKFRPTCSPLQRVAVSCAGTAAVRRTPRPGSRRDVRQRAAASAVRDKSIPNERQLETWRDAQAVCFDVDCTILKQDSLDLLAEFLGKGSAVEEFTNRAMDGTMNLEEALEERLKILDCTPADLQRFTVAHPPTARITDGAADLIASLQARGVEIYLISGSFRELILPLAKLLNIPPRNVMANRMNWHMDDDTGLPSKLAGFDPTMPVAHNKGKPAAIRELRNQHPYQHVVMVGDGITDLEAVQEAEGGADLFIGYGGVVVREKVLEGAEWFVHSHKDLLQYLKHRTVAVIGSGAWACAAARMVAQNTSLNDPADEFTTEVKMWVYEEELEDGHKLTEVMNEQHENVKYFEGVKLPKNLVACPDIEQVAQDADILIFCAPHQFMRGIVAELQGKVKEGAFAVSLTKGMRVKKDGPQLISQLITSQLHMNCSVLMGANVAEGIGKEQLSEATIGYTNIEHARVLQKLFARPYFHVNTIPDVAGAEMAGTLKNIVAVAAGFVDGLGFGANSKAAIMRQGLWEMRQLAKSLYPTVRDETFMESCGVADLIATCYGGRNRLVAQAWAEFRAHGSAVSFPKLSSCDLGAAPTFAELEYCMLDGQKLQGVLTSDEVQDVLRYNGWQEDYPLFTAVNRIIHSQAPVQSILKYRDVASRAASDASDGEDPYGVAAAIERAAGSLRVNSF